MTTPKVDTERQRVWFGRHKGVLWTRIPVSYLRWIVNNKEFHVPENKALTFAQAELDRRGTVVDQTIEISGHAIDRASLRLRGKWRKLRSDDNEGLHAWLVRIATKALAEGEKNERSGKVLYENIWFVFTEGEYFPVLLSIMPHDE